MVKTPQCSQDSFRLSHCPTCSSEGRALAEGLPCAHHGQSFLICRQVNRFKVALLLLVLTEN